MPEDDMKKGYALLEEQLKNQAKEIAELREMVQLHAARYEIATGFMADVLKKMAR